MSEEIKLTKGIRLKDYQDFQSAIDMFCNELNLTPISYRLDIENESKSVFVTFSETFKPQFFAKMYRGIAALTGKVEKVGDTYRQISEEVDFALFILNDTGELYLLGHKNKK